MKIKIIKQIRVINKTTTSSKNKIEEMKRQRELN